MQNAFSSVYMKMGTFKKRGHEKLILFHIYVIVFLKAQFLFLQNSFFSGGGGGRGANFFFKQIFL